MKTASEIETDIYNLLKNTAISTAVSGKVYRDGYRPKDSNLEDAIVIFTSGLSDQIETGVITVLIYVPDVDVYQNGTKLKNGARILVLEQAAKTWVNSLNASVSNYLFELNQTIMSLPDPEIHQHFISIRLNYKFFV